MSKVVTYICDCCVIIRPLDELEAVQVYVFGTPDAEVKRVDYEHVCPDCRQELLNLMNKWLHKGKPAEKKDDVEIKIRPEAAC